VLYWHGLFLLQSSPPCRVNSQPDTVPTGGHSLAGA
jgi:hypothetical protein